MLKDYYNEIIPPWDSRYGKLGHIWKKYNYKDLITYLGPHSYQYKIIPELVIKSYDTIHIYVGNNKNDNNLVANRVFKRIIKLTTDLTDESYYLLMHNHSNNINDYLRCANCHCKLGFCSFIRGYNSGGRYEGDLIGNTTCSPSCLLQYKYKQPSLYGLTGFVNPKVNAKTKRSWFINQGLPTDYAVLYITYACNHYKYGISADPDQRGHRYNSYKEGDGELEIIVESTRVQIANIEYLIKSRLNWKEYTDLSHDDLVNLIKDTYNKYINHQLTIDDI